MLPDNSNYEILSNYDATEQPNMTYKLDRINKRIVAVYEDYEEIIRQAVYLALLTERYSYAMYSWNYGIELSDLFGRERQYVIPMLMSRIKEALLQDDRILNVTGFSFDVNKSIYSVSFTVVTKYSDVDIKDVIFNV
jgi:phage protein